MHFINATNILINILLKFNYKFNQSSKIKIFFLMDFWQKLIGKMFLSQKVCYYITEDNILDETIL